MVLLYLKNQLQLKDDATHISTRFELSDTINFSNIIDFSESTINKHAVLFNRELDPSVKYYARARALLSTGWTKHANLDVVDVRLSGLTGYKNSVLPSKLSTPILTTNSTQDKHAITNFTIEANGFNRIGTSVHNKTIYMVTDIDNNLLWYRVTELELNKIEVNDLILEENKMYKIHAIFGSSSYDHSQVATMSIVTGGNDNLHLLSSSSVIRGNDYIVNFMKVEGMEHIDISLYEINGTVSQLVYETRINGITGIIPKIHLDKDLYILKSKSNLDIIEKNNIIQVTV